jgi:hypothetical protein
MKITIPMMTAVAAALLVSGCERNNGWEASDNTRLCVDRQGRRMADEECNRGGVGAGSFFAWYYLTRGGYIPRYGQPVTGGSYVAAPDASYRPGAATAISRGGFGSSAHGSAGE